MNVEINYKEKMSWNQGHEHIYYGCNTTANIWGDCNTANNLINKKQKQFYA